jgi:hypothetical protein
MRYDFLKVWQSTADESLNEKNFKIINILSSLPFSSLNMNFGKMNP